MQGIRFDFADVIEIRSVKCMIALSGTTIYGWPMAIDF